MIEDFRCIQHIIKLIAIHTERKLIQVLIKVLSNCMALLIELFSCFSKQAILMKLDAVRLVDVHEESFRSRRKMIRNYASML
jgi:hypothetical protein